MATYYVNKTGDDAHDTTEAQTPATGWLTIDKAANEVAAGDTVVVSPGTYRETVTMDTSGTNGSEIDFIADVDGSLAGLGAGLVVVSAFTDSNTASRASCLDPNHKDFFTWTGFVFQGGTSGAIYNFAAGDTCYEGVVFQDCVFVQAPDNSDYCFYIHANAATTPTQAGLTVRRCTFSGAGIRYSWKGQETADQNLKVTIDSSLFVGQPSSSAAYSALYWDAFSAGTFHSGGVDFINNTVFGFVNGVYVAHLTPTVAGYTVDVRNCYIAAAATLVKQTSNDGALTSDYNTTIGASAFVTSGANDRDETSTVLLGGIADAPLRRFLGWSPYAPFEPMRPNTDDDWTSLIGDADSTVAPADDLYGSPRTMSQAGTARTVYHFDVSDAGPTDNEGTWAGDADAFNGDITDKATTSTVGTEANDELRGEGTNAPATGGTISKVEARYFSSSTDVTGDVTLKIYEDAEAAQRLSLSDSNQPPAGAWTAWTDCGTHTAGWTWPKIQALETVFWMTGGTDIGVHAIQIRVTHTAGNADDRGAVEGRARAEQETGTIRTGTNALRLEGAGWHDMLVPVAAQSTTITVYARKDGNYAGATEPQLHVYNIPGVADKTDALTVAAGNWEQLTSGAFTPTAAGVCRVRLQSSDTSVDGICFFDDLVVT